MESAKVTGRRRQNNRPPTSLGKTDKPNDQTQESHCRPTAPTSRQVILLLLVGALFAAASCLVEAASELSSSSRSRLPVSSRPGHAPSPVTHASYFGTPIGRLESSPNRAHNISGQVFAVDEQTVFIKGFTFDGRAPDTYFWSTTSAVVGTNTPPSQDGFIVPDEKGSTKPLERYDLRDLVLRLPEGKTLKEIPHLSVWSRQLRRSLADVQVSSQLQPPRPLEVAPLSQLAHGLRSGPITLVDAQTLLVPDFHYDGEAPAAFFWLSRGGSGLAASGLKLKDENGAAGPLRKYSGETLVISLPDELTLHDFDYFGVWCTQFGVNFGQTRLPSQARVPPSPKMLGIKPENKLNCEILYDELGFEIRWVLDGDDIVMQLVGKIEPGEYMAFGLGKDDSKSEMRNADAVVTWVDHQSGQVHALDYFLGAKSQCLSVVVATGSGGSTSTNATFQGTCPDVKLTGGGDSLTLLHGAIVNGYSMVTFKRPQLAIDELYDQHVYSDGQQSVLWAIGSLNERQELGYHRLRSRQNMFIDFARHPQWNCPIPDLNASMSGPSGPPTSLSGSGSHLSSQASQVEPQLAPEAAVSSTPSQPEESAEKAIHQDQQQSHRQQQVQNQDAATWFVPPIICPTDRTFYFQLGPAGGRRGQASRPPEVAELTNQPTVWYVNGLLAPELVIERGHVYRFVVEGGADRSNPNRRHPLYLTDSPQGGLHLKTDEERARERILGGVALRADGQLVPTAEGRLCEWRTGSGSTNASQYNSFAAYQRSLQLECSPTGGQPGLLRFSADSTTPEVIYYQCYSSRNMGGRIRVVDVCPSSAFVSGSSSNKAMASQTQPSSVALITAASNNRRQNIASGQINNKREAQSRPTRSPKQDPMLALQSESRMGDAMGEPTPDELTAHLLGASMNNHLPSGRPFGHELEELTQLPTDALILNNSQLNQPQPFNMSQLEELLRISGPGALEFEADQPIQNQIKAQLLQHHLRGGHHQTYQQKIPPSFVGLYNPNILANKTSGLARPNYQQQPQQQQLPKPQGTFQSYVRRLASIYYPVQQSIASMLSPLSQHSPLPVGHQTNNLPKLTHVVNSEQQQQQASPGNPFHVSLGGIPNHLMPSPSEQTSSFSLASLMPGRPKIDLSKSNLSKKLSKLRFKTGRKLEQTGPSISHSQQPEPPKPNAQITYDLFQEQLAQFDKQSKAFQATLESLDASDGRGPIGSIDWTDGPTSGPPTIQEQQTNEGNSATSSVSSIESPSNLVDALIMQSALSVNQHESPVSQQQGSIYITRLTDGRGAPTTAYQQPNMGPFSGADHNQLAARYPPIRPYGLPPPTAESAAQVILGTGTAHYRGTNSHPQQQQQQRQQAPAAIQEQPVTGESLSGSGSGSHYDFRRPTVSSQGVQADQLDHMMAIERFSKQSSERAISQQNQAQQQVNDQLGGSPEVLVVNSQGEQESPVAQDDPLVTTSTGSTGDQPEVDAIQTSTTPTPRRYSSILADGNIMVSSEAPPTSTISSGSTSSSSIITTALVRPTIGGPDGPTVAPSSSTSAGLVMVDDIRRLNSSISQRQQQPVSSTIGSVEASSGPLVPMGGPNESVLRQNSDSLLGPPSSNMVLASHQSPAPLSRLTYDMNPFVPIQLVSTGNDRMLRAQQQAAAASQLMAARLRPPPIVETMLSERRLPSRPEPPVQLASYLAHQLAGAASNPNQLVIASDKSAASSAPLGVHLSAQSPFNGANNSENSPSSTDLIILKPLKLNLTASGHANSLGANQNTGQSSQNQNNNQHTYILKPEFLHTHFRPMSTSHLYNQNAHLSNQIDQGERNERPLMVGNQFDRLSSLATPFSRSMALDPMMAANSILRQTNHDDRENAAQQGLQASANPDQDGNSPTRPAHHRASAPLPALVFLSSTSADQSLAEPEGIRPNPGGENTISSRLIRDNNTDNAILSHVMSLISANADVY